MKNTEFLVKEFAFPAWPGWERSNYGTNEVTGPKARALIKRDSSVISPSYPRDYGFVMDHGKGSEVWDVDGNRFLDFMAGIAVNFHRSRSSGSGQGHPGAG
jgi:hypothetical protein